MDLDEAIHTAILTLKEGFEGAITAENIEIGVIGGEFGGKFTVLSQERVAEFLAETE